MTLFLRLEGREIMKSRLHLQPSQTKTMISYIPDGPRMGPSTRRGPSGSTMRFSALHIFTTTYHWGSLSFILWWRFFPFSFSLPTGFLLVHRPPLVLFQRGWMFMTVCHSCSHSGTRDLTQCVLYLPLMLLKTDSSTFHSQTAPIRKVTEACPDVYAWSWLDLASISPSFAAIRLLDAELGKRSIWALF